MAHGRKRLFFSGLVLGGFLSLAVLGLTVGGYVWAKGIPWAPPGYPLFAENAKECTLLWARLSPFPPEARSFTLTTSGGAFTRQFEARFFGEPQAVAAWVASCPGVKDPACVKWKEEDGTLIYKIVPGEGALLAELSHHPQRGTVSIRTYWD